MSIKPQASEQVSGKFRIYDRRAVKAYALGRVMEEHHQDLWDTNMISDYYWSLIHHFPKSTTSEL